MKHYIYIVKFVTGIKARIYAFNKAEATILAQAEQIRKGNEYAIESIVEESDNEQAPNQ